MNLPRPGLNLPRPGLSLPRPGCIALRLRPPPSLARQQLLRRARDGARRRPLPEPHVEAELLPGVDGPAGVQCAPVEAAVPVHIHPKQRLA